MIVDGKQTRPIWLADDLETVRIIDQRFLPHKFLVVDLKNADDAVAAIQDMYVRGAPLIGVTAAYGIFLAVRDADGDEDLLAAAGRKLMAARPTAVNLTWAINRVMTAVSKTKSRACRVEIARKEAEIIAEEETQNCKKIGDHGATLIDQISRRKNGEPVNILTHCNAGWLACVEYGTATAPVYRAYDQGINLHVWVDETRPVNQGARLTAWELGKHGVPHTVIADNAGGHLMQHGKVDLVIVGTDRTTYTGDVANKIGTYLKALAARDNNIPFYVALPSSTFDWTIRDGVKEIPIEEREADEIRYVQGWDGHSLRSVLVPPPESPAANYAFDVTPAKLVTGFITERGICRATEADIRALFPEKS
jgi:methylthioribose-1-phosphate isomerase